MFRNTVSVLASLLSIAIPSFAAPPSLSSAGSAMGLRVMSWNIWHGGKEDGTEIGPRRVVDVIRDHG